MSRYARGRSLEYEIAALFRSAGYSIIRGSSSKGEVAGFKADLVASKVGQDKRTIFMVLLQCKRLKS